MPVLLEEGLGIPALYRLRRRQRQCQLQGWLWLPLSTGEEKLYRRAYGARRPGTLLRRTENEEQYYKRQADAEACHDQH